MRNPGEILAFLSSVSFANIEAVAITNLTTDEISRDVHVAPDGSFSSYVPVDPGRNELQIAVLARDGGESTILFDVNFEQTALTENELSIELERLRKRNKERLLLLERKRIRAFRELRKGVITLEQD